MLNLSKLSFSWAKRKNKNSKLKTIQQVLNLTLINLKYNKFNAFILILSLKQANYKS